MENYNHCKHKAKLHVFPTEATKAIHKPRIKNNEKSCGSSSIKSIQVVNIKHFWRIFYNVTNCAFVTRKKIMFLHTKIQISSQKILQCYSQMFARN